MTNNHHDYLSIKAVMVIVPFLFAQQSPGVCGLELPTSFHDHKDCQNWDQQNANSVL